MGRAVANAAAVASRIHSREIIKKICVLGDASSGKTQLLKRYVYSMFDDKYITTIGTKVTKKSMDFDREAAGEKWGVRITFLVWDILGQKQYSSLHPVYYQGAEGAFVVCDGRRPPITPGLREWAHSLVEVTGPVPLLFLVNHADEASAGPLDTAALEALCNEFGASFMSVDDSTGLNVDAAFAAMGGMLVDRYIASGRAFGEFPPGPPPLPWHIAASFLRRFRRRPKTDPAQDAARLEIRKIAQAIGAPEPSL